jgi:parallel beta-helix repeat protein
MRAILIVATALLLTLFAMQYFQLADANPTSLLPALPVITIAKDGSITPSTEYVEKSNGVYNLTSDMIGLYTLKIDCNNIVLDGNGHAINSSYRTSGYGIVLTNASNVVLRNLTVSGFSVNIILQQSSNCSISYVNSSYSWDGNWASIVMIDSESTVLNQCKIIGNIEGVLIQQSDNCKISNNYFSANKAAVSFDSSQKNTFSQNDVFGSSVAIYFIKATSQEPSNNIIYLNNFSNCSTVAKFIDYSVRSYYGISFKNYWDFNKAGNYWSNYSVSGSYVIDENNVDHYPLLQPVDISQSASVPEFSWLTILPILLTIPIALAIVRKKLQRNV